MIDPKELRIGNWVSGYAHRGAMEKTPIQVTGIGRDGINLEWEGAVLMYSYNLPQLEPIPLTHEILFRCGFVFLHKAPVDCGSSEFYNIGRFRIRFHLGVFNETANGIIITSFHQLQNLYFAISGGELIYSPYDKINH